MRKIHFHKSFLAMAALSLLLPACTNDDVTQNGEDEDTGNVAGVIFEGKTQTPASGVTTRTTATHLLGGNAQVYWEDADQIWVKDDGGTFRQSSAATFGDASNKAHASFGLTTGSFTGTTHQVVYTGKNSTSATEVEIKATQTQAITNSFAHLGESGDCGIATARKIGGWYNFSLDHKAAYLAIYPRIENEPLHKNVKITKIVLTSTSGPIAGKYDFSTGSLGSTPASSASNSITLLTTSGEISSATRADTCYYVVIAPGNHTLTAVYHIEDPTTTVTKTIKKNLGTIPCTEGKITDITAWIDKELVDFNSFYMWDAEKPYWYGYESVQPFTHGESNPNYPQPGDNRYYNPPVSPSTEGSHNPLFMTSSARHVPNMNEMSWYLLKGNPQWDAAGIYVFNGHLRQGRGVWLKKMSKIIADNAADVAAAGGDVKEMGVGGWPGPYHDYRTSFMWFTARPGNTPPTGDEQDDYFFLPFTIGYYSGGTYYNNLNSLYVQGPTAQYLTSTWGGFGIYYLYEDFGGLTVYYGGGGGLVAVPFL